MGEQHLLDLLRRDVLAARDDHVVGAAEHVQVPVRVDPAEVAGVAAIRPRPATPGATLGPRTAIRPSAPIRTSAWASGGPDRAGRARGLARARSVGDLGGGLGEAVGRRHRDARRRARARPGRRGAGPPPSSTQRRRPGADAGVEQAGEHRRHQRGERDRLLGQQRGDRARVERARARPRRRRSRSATGSTGRRRGAAACSTASGPRARRRSARPIRARSRDVAVGQLDRPRRARRCRTCGSRTGPRPGRGGRPAPRPGARGALGDLLRVAHDAAGPSAARGAGSAPAAWARGSSGAATAPSAISACSKHDVVGRTAPDRAPRASPARAERREAPRRRAGAPIELAVGERARPRQRASIGRRGRAAASPSSAAEALSFAGIALTRRFT